MGIVSSLVSLGTGLLISWLSTLLRYADLMLAACGISAVLVLLSILAHFLCKPILTQVAPEQAKQQSVNVLQLFRQPVFYKMIPANTLRGFAYGITTVMATVALSLGYGESVATAILPVQSFAMLVSYGLFGIGITRTTPRFLVLLGCATFLLIPLLLIKSAMLYLVIFAVMLVGRTIVDNAALPLVVFE